MATEQSQLMECEDCPNIEMDNSVIENLEEFFFCNKFGDYVRLVGCTKEEL